MREIVRILDNSEQIDFWRPGIGDFNFFRKDNKIIRRFSIAGVELLILAEYSRTPTILSYHDNYTLDSTIIYKIIGPYKRKKAKSGERYLYIERLFEW